MFQYSVIVKGIESRFKKQGYEVETITDNFGSIMSKVSESPLFISYLPGDILENDRKLNSFAEVSKMINSVNGKMIILGEMQYHSELIQTMPEIQAFEWVNKPIDMEKLSMLVETMINMKPGSSTKKRILIVDDDDSYAGMVMEWIKDDYRVDIVTAGMQAITFLLKLNEHEQVDMILLDYEMPVVDGPQVLQMLRQESATARIPVIFLTGIGTKEAVGRVMSLKPDGYILKSTTRDDLLSYLHKKLH